MDIVEFLKEVEQSIAQMEADADSALNEVEELEQLLEDITQ